MTEKGQNRLLMVMEWFTCHNKKPKLQHEISIKCEESWVKRVVKRKNCVIIFTRGWRMPPDCEMEEIYHGKD